MTDSDDPLARTATAPAAPRSDEIGGTIGRYRIERELGRGGMGVVHAALDPDLERRVALKVLRTGSDEAEQRLLREARAMARLTHPNVVTVFEVGSVGGRDYVAMELIDGQSLVEWLREAQRSPREILDAFVAAGRGLAAAHEAGIVHRDFKPHNVLRSRAGRIAVTDFGLAREASSDPVAAVPVSAVPGETQSALSGLTVPGALLGTPAYMAPEQWAGGAVTPATDQFAYCVALWEALTGERPYRGATIEALGLAIAEGPGALDASKLPRRLRGLLRRGLEVDPARRWPSITALLARITVARRGPLLAVAGGAAAVAIAVGAWLALRDRGAPGAACEPPVLEPVAVTEQQFGPRGARALAAFRDRDARWRGMRALACTEPDALRRTHLACLDRVAVRNDAVRRARELVAGWGSAGIAPLLAEPAACLLEEPPKLPERYSEAAIVGLSRRFGAEPPTLLVERARAALDRDPCARAYHALADGEDREARTHETGERAVEASRLCGDDEASAEAAMLALGTSTTSYLTPDLPSALRRVEAAVARAASPDLDSKRLLQRARFAVFANQTEEALATLDRAEARAQEPELRWIVRAERVETLLLRAQRADYQRVARELDRMRAQAVDFPGGVLPAREASYLEWIDATVQWNLGDVAAASARLRRVDLTWVGKKPAPRTLTGTVVDERGHPVAGATVVAGRAVAADSAGIGLRLFDPLGIAAALDRATTDAAGRFTLEHAPEPPGAVAAETGDRRSLGAPLADGVRLVVLPTTRIAGRVEGAGTSTVGVIVRPTAPGGSDAYVLGAPVAVDGTFELAGVPRGKLLVGTITSGGGIAGNFTWTTVDTRTGSHDHLVLAASPGRRVRVLVRSNAATPVDGALVFVATGAVRATKLRDFTTLMRGDQQTGFEQAFAVIGEPAADIAGQFRRGDVLATLTSAPHAPSTVCAAGVQVDLRDPEFQARLARHADELDVRCVPLPADASVVVVEVPPMKRLD